MILFLHGELPGDFLRSATNGFLTLTFSLIDGLKFTNVLLKLSI